jgi:hypothetical protein
MLWSAGQRAGYLAAGKRETHPVLTATNPGIVLR